jgi:holliday junction DNA helicase RuvA
MISFLHGQLVEALPTQVTVNVNGVGYEILIPLSSFDKLPQPGQEVRLLTHLVVREDAHVLYGFASADERDLFRLLINNVSGIGPKTALNVLSGMNPVAFRGAVAGGDAKALSQISGVGKKTAERIVVELRDKIGAAGAWEASSARRGLSPTDQKLNDGVLALMALGFKQVEAHEAVRQAQAVLGLQATVEELVRACLKRERDGRPRAPIHGTPAAARRAAPESGRRRHSPSAHAHPTACRPCAVSPVAGCRGDLALSGDGSLRSF